jgi:ATP-dependent DNA helicase PIF1
LHLPTKGEFRELQGEQVQHLQETLTDVRYIIIDEMSMVGRKLFGQIDKRLRQAFPRSADKVLGNCSCLLFGDFGQLPPVMDLPLYSSDVRSALSDLGRTAYQSFNKAIVLTQVMRQAGQDSEQVRFREILLRLRDAHVTIDDWQHLMTRSLACITHLIRTL